jgi:hypothetical protein
MKRKQIFSNKYRMESADSGKCFLSSIMMNHTIDHSISYFNKEKHFYRKGAKRMRISKKPSGELPTAKPASPKKPLNIQQARLSLELFQDANFSGRRIRFRRRGVAVRNMNAFAFNDLLSSFRMSNPNNPGSLTLVLWEDVNYSGRRQVFFGSRSVPFVGPIFNDLTSSFIFVPRRLTSREINRIEATGSAAFLGVVEISA